MNRGSGAGAEQLRALCGRVEHWRAHRDGGRSVVPEDLWNAAVEVARVEGVYATSKALRFNYRSLRDRLIQGDRTARRPKRRDRTATFVEVPMPSPASPAPRVAAGGQTIVELVRTGGARMRIEVTGTSSLDVVGLAQAFWGGEP